MRKEEGKGKVKKKKEENEKKKEKNIIIYSTLCLRYLDRNNGHGKFECANPFGDTSFVK